MRRAAVALTALLLLAACHSVDAPVVVGPERDRVIGVVERAQPKAVVTGFAGYSGCCDSGAPGLLVEVDCVCDLPTREALADEVLRTVWETYAGPVENEVRVEVQDPTDRSAPPVERRRAYDPEDGSRPDGFEAERYT